MQNRAGDAGLRRQAFPIFRAAFDGDPFPDAVTLLSYSQSSEPSSPHYADQTELYSRGRWVTERFCEGAIQASPELSVLKLRLSSSSLVDD